MKGRPVCGSSHAVAHLKGPGPTQQSGEEVRLPRAVRATDDQDSHRLDNGSKQL